MTILTNEAQKRKIRESGRILSEIFEYLKKEIKEGVSTSFIDKEVERIIRENGGEPAFKGYKGYPSTICASVNEVVVHGIPSERIILNEGDIVGIDMGVKKNGYYADAARTYFVGRISDRARRLVEVTRQCLAAGVSQAIAGNRVSDISNAIQTAASSEGLKEVRSFVGHGIGKALHEPPEVPNWGEKGKGPVLKDGLVLAIEPMINLGSREVKVLPDGWTAVTADSELSAHFEDTIIVGTDKAEIIT